jgi:hypothetical protein
MIIQSVPYPNVVGTSWAADLTVASGTVASDLTDFPLYIDLADMPVGFWTYTNGKDIRAYVTGSQIPCDIVWCDTVTQTGAIFVKVPTLAAASDTIINLQGNGTDGLPPVASTYGRNAVWDDYESVFLMGITAGDDRTGKAAGAIVGDPDFFTQTATSSTDTDGHQGVCWDGTFYYTTDNNTIRKWDASWTLIASNADPIGASGVVESPALNHCGDPDYFDGHLYIPVEYFDGVGPTYSTPYIMKFDTSLAFVAAYDISAQGHEASSIAYCDRDGLLYITDYVGNDNKLFRYKLDGTYVGYKTTSESITLRQGITWWRNYFWISTDTFEETVRVAYDGTTDYDQNGDFGGIGLGSEGAGVAYEGISHTNTALLQVVDPGATERVETWEPNSINLGAQGGCEFGRTTSWVQASGRAHYDTFTLGVTMNLNSKPARNQTGVSYADTDTAASANNRVGISYRSTDILGIWDLNNSWLDSGTVFTVGTSYRCHAVYNGTMDRKVYVNGALGATDATVVAIPSGLDRVYIGAEDTDEAEILDGLAGFVYLRPSVLSANWLAAEYSNLNAPSSFYSVAGATVIDGTRVPSGDMQSGTDRRILAGDMQSGTDARITRDVI